MNFLVIGIVPHKKVGDQFFGYGPYVREMNIWFKHVEKVTVLGPLYGDTLPDPIDLPYEHPNLTLIQVPEFSLLSPAAISKTIINFPKLWLATWKAIKAADHIHLRCPSNIGLLGAVIQIFFPNKVKTAKYAGNWDLESKQPLTYRLQQKILSSTFLTKNIQVLVYGKWPNQSQNIKPFFTATYSVNEKVETAIRAISAQDEIRLIFVGGLNSGKQPLISAKVCHEMNKKGFHVTLDLYGEGPERKKLENYIKLNNLSDRIFLHGNVPADEVKKSFQKAHFLIFISESEGWPKVVAESMFWGCVPITTPVSCVPEMLGNGQRGFLVNPDPQAVTEKIDYLVNNPSQYKEMAQKAMDWSRIYTLEKFEDEIELLLH